MCPVRRTGVNDESRECVAVVVAGDGGLGVTAAVCSYAHFPVTGHCRIKAELLRVHDYVNFQVIQEGGHQRKWQVGCGFWPNGG